MRHCASIRTQRGASLLIALIFLAIMAMLGVTVANVTVLQERMAGHTRDRDLALQAAEAALRDAEARLATDAAFRAAAIQNVASNSNDSTYWEACFAGSVGPCATKYDLTTALPAGAGAVAAPPKYVLEKTFLSGTTQVYRVTARAVGGSADAVVILQAEFDYTGPPAPPPPGP